MGNRGFLKKITTLALSASLFLAGCNEPMEPEVFVSDTVAFIGCEADFKESLFNNIFRNLSQGKALPSAEDLAPYLTSQLDKLQTSERIKADHLTQIEAAYLKVYEVILRYRDQDLGVPGSYGHWLADIESGTIYNEEQKAWADDLNTALKDLDAAAEVLNTHCASDSAAPVTASQPLSNDAFFLSVETLRMRGSEAQPYLQERQSNAYLERGYLQTPARIYTDSEAAEPEAQIAPGEQEPAENSDDVAQETETLAPAPSNWTPLMAHSTSINIKPPDQTPTAAVTEPLPGSDQGTFVDNLFRSYHPVFAGALKTMAVLYQSCNVLDLPLVDSSAPRIQGLSRAGTDRVYRKPLYEIWDQELFAETHYYLSRLDQSHDPGLVQCRNTRDEFQSMYVYSGEADVTSVEKNMEPKAAINLFRQASASGLEPGMDCSAFVSVALQAGGLKYKTGGSCTAYRRLGNTLSLINYERNNYNCLFEPQRDSVNSNSATGPVDLAPGDIFTVGDYHTVIIGQTGYNGEIPDPFRLRDIEDVSQCKLENFTYDRFDFDIIHSSATRSQVGTAPDTGLGVARHHARSYFKTDRTMGEHLRRYAVQACHRKFNPDAPAYSPANMNILRHKPVAECMCPERTLLYKESCLNSCSLP